MLHYPFYLKKKCSLFLLLWLPFTTCRPYTILGKSLLGIARSSLFLSVYCASAWWVDFLPTLMHLLCHCFFVGMTIHGVSFSFSISGLGPAFFLEPSRVAIPLLSSLARYADQFWHIIPASFLNASFMTLNYLRMTVSDRFGTIYWEEEQKNWDIPVLPCQSHWKLFHMHDWCRTLPTNTADKESRCSRVQYSYLNHYALLCAGKRSFPVQVPECSRLGIWCATAARQWGQV